MCSNPKSLPAAVSSDVSVVSAIAGYARRFAHVAHDVFGRHVLRVGRAAAVAAEEQRAAAVHRLPHHAERSVEIRPERFGDGRRQPRELAEATGEMLHAILLTKSSPIAK